MKKRISLQKPKLMRFRAFPHNKKFKWIKVLRKTNKISKMRKKRRKLKNLFQLPKVLKLLLNKIVSKQTLNKK